MLENEKKKTTSVNRSADLIAKMVILLQVIYHFNPNSINVQTASFTEPEKTSYNKCGTKKRHGKAETVLKKKWKPGDITIPKSKLYYKALLTETAYH